MVRLNHDHQQISLQHLLNFQVKHVIKTMRDHHLMIGKYDNYILYFYILYLLKTSLTYITTCLSGHNCAFKTGVETPWVLTFAKLYGQQGGDEKSNCWNMIYGGGMEKGYGVNVTKRYA